MNEKITSQSTGKTYAPGKAVRILNQLQAASYIAHGAELLDIYTSRNFETGRPMLVYIFNREATAELYDLWCKHELL